MTFLTIGVACVVFIAMEPWSRVLHRDAWHGPLYAVHHSHHEPTGPLEANDLFALAHAVPAATLIVLGLEFDGWLASIGLGVGCGMTAFGAAYALVHEGLVHERFPVPFLNRFRWLRRVKAAHQAHHHTGLAPYGLFLGLQELQAESRAVAARKRAERAAT